MEPRFTGLIVHERQLAVPKPSIGSGTASVLQLYALWPEEQGCANWREYFLPPTGTMDPSITYKWPIPEQFHYNAWIAERTNSRLEQYKKSG